MSKPAIRIDAVPVKELEAVAARARNEPGVVPITPRRARSHATNPNAEPDDVGLLVAYIGDRCVGYLGIMAGALVVNGERRRMHWLSSWYVDPAESTSGAGTMLLMRAIGLKYDLAVTGTSREADDMYRAMRFTEMVPLKYEEIFLDALDPLGFPFFALGKWLERRGKSPDVPNAIAKPLRRIAQPALKRLVYALIGPARGGDPKPGSNTVCHLVERYRSEPAANAAPHFLRDDATVNWMLETQWFTENPSDAVDGYFFGDYRPLHRFHVLRIERGGEAVGMAVVSASQRPEHVRIKVLDYWLSSESERIELVKHAIEIAARFRADRVLFPHEFRPQLQGIPILGRLTFTRTRNYFCKPSKKTSVLTPVMDSIELQLADGDCAFS